MSYEFVGCLEEMIHCVYEYIDIDNNIEQVMFS